MAGSLASDRMDWMDAASSVHMDYTTGPAKSLNLNNIGPTRSVICQHVNEPAKSIGGPVSGNAAHSVISPSARLHGDDSVETREQQLTAQLIRASGLIEIHEQQLLEAEADRRLLSGIAESEVLSVVQQISLAQSEDKISELAEAIRLGHAEVERLEVALKTEREVSRRVILAELGASPELEVAQRATSEEFSEAVDKIVREDKGIGLKELLRRVKEGSDPRTSLWEGRLRTRG
jgi:hypothetical protein